MARDDLMTPQEHKDRPCTRNRETVSAGAGTPGACQSDYIKK